MGVVDCGWCCCCMRERVSVQLFNVGYATGLVDAPSLPGWCLGDRRESLINNQITVMPCLLRVNNVIYTANASVSALAEISVLTGSILSKLAWPTRRPAGCRPGSGLPRLDSSLTPAAPFLPNPQHIKMVRTTTTTAPTTTETGMLMPVTGVRRCVEDPR